MPCGPERLCLSSEMWEKSPQTSVWTSSQRLGLVVLLAPYVQYLLVGCLDIFTEITNEGREIVDYTNSGDETSANKSANGVDWNSKRANVDTGSAEIAFDSEQLACAQ